VVVKSVHDGCTTTQLGRSKRCRWRCTVTHRGRRQLLLAAQIFLEFGCRPPQGIGIGLGIIMAAAKVEVMLGVRVGDQFERQAAPGGRGRQRARLVTRQQSR
jgi:hypothetical protein